ncbi:uncharacterized protein [Chironomus tepperi]|uniref:uncharacterized protein n=1 Tax=Chironomus tepperi TaxID=113505 RepID=UPI00391F429F
MVSKSWYSMIGTSSKTMEKIQLGLFSKRGSRKMTSEVANILIKSPRQYQNVAIKFQSLDMDNFQLIIESACKNWKKVEIERITLKSATNLISMLKVYQNTVEDLDLDNLSVINGIGLEALDFPKLKVLKLFNVDIRKSTVNDIFVNCKNIEDLHITSEDYCEKSITSLKTILKNNRNLKHLLISPALVNLIFDEETSYDFKLHTFITKTFDDQPENVNYNHMINSQFDNLKKLSIDGISCPDIIKRIFKMPKLKCLNIGKVDTKSLILSNNLNINKSIEELSYHDDKKDFDFMCCLVDALPNLKKVDMYALTQNMMEYLSSSLKELTALKLRTLNAVDLSSPDLFPNLESAQIDILPSDLEDHVLLLDDDEVNPLVMLLDDIEFLVLD